MWQEALAASAWSGVRVGALGPEPRDPTPPFSRAPAQTAPPARGRRAQKRRVPARPGGRTPTPARVSSPCRCVTYSDPFGLWPECTPWPHCSLEQAGAGKGWGARLARALDKFNDFNGVNSTAKLGVALRDGDTEGAVVAGINVALELDGARGPMALARGRGVLPTRQAAELAEYVGYGRRARDVPFNSHGQPVFSDGKNYITPDIDSHNGGVWKMFDRRGNRVGTYDALMNRIRE